MTNEDIQIEVVETVNHSHRDWSGFRIGKTVKMKIVEGDTVRYEYHHYWYENATRFVRMTTTDKPLCKSFTDE